MDKEIEKTLTDMGIDFVYKQEIAISKIDFEASKANQARIMEPVKKEVVSFYVEALKQGDIFPPILVYEVDGKYINIDANHRTFAADQAGFTVWPHGAYIVENLTDEQFRILAYSANLTHGFQASRNDRISHAIWLVEKMGETAKDAAEKMKVNTDAVLTDMRYKKAIKRALLLDKKVSQLPKTSLLKINTIPDDEIFGEVVGMFSKKNTIDEVTLVVDEILKEGTYKKQLEVLKKNQDYLKRTGGVGDSIRKYMMLKKNGLLRSKAFISDINLNDFNKDSKLREECKAMLLAISDTAYKKANQ